MSPASAIAAAAGDADQDAAATPLLSEPIPFVMLSEDSMFEIAPEAVAYLKQIKGTVAVVSIAGLYRTGKSYLLNMLLGRDRAEAMFNVGATVNACTKGIWIWGQPIQLSAVADLAAESAMKHLPKDTTIVFMDTEGLGSTQRSQTQDTRIFALALLLSSLFIYNSRGVIDSSAIEDLSLVVNLTKYIQAKSHAASEEDGTSEGRELAAFFPDFLWVVRDFTLQLQEEGRKMSPRDYFESALKHQPPMTEEIAQKNRIRTLLSTFFPMRDCVTLVRPLNDENLLRNLINQPYESLRPEFREQMHVLKNKVFSSLKPKKMMTNLLNGAMLVSLAQNYVDAFNSGSSPVIATVWDRVIESQCDEALESAKNAFKRHFEDAVAQATKPVSVGHTVLPRPIEESDINELYEKARQLAEKELQREDLSANSSMETYREELSEYMLDSLQEVYAKCEEISVSYNRALLSELYKPKEESFDSASNSSDDTAQALQNTLTGSRALIEEVVANYRDQALGSSKSVVLGDFLSEKLVEGLIEWGTAVKASFRASETKLDGQIGTLKQTLRSVEGKVRAAQEVLAQQKESYGRALQSISERIAEERSTLRDDIQNKQSEIDRVHLQVERLASLHKEALTRLDAQLEESKDERKRLEEAAREEQARRESERQEANRQLLESERNFHREEKDLLQSQQQFLQKIIDLERQLGEQDTEEMKEIFRLEKESQQQSTQLTLKYQDERDELKERTIQDIRKLNAEQDEELAVLSDELNEKKALLSSLREQLEAKEAVAEMKKAKANSFFGSSEDCVLQRATDQLFTEDRIFGRKRHSHPSVARIPRCTCDGVIGVLSPEFPQPGSRQVSREGFSSTMSWEKYGTDRQETAQLDPATESEISNELQALVTKRKRERLAFGITALLSTAAVTGVVLNSTRGSGLAVSTLSQSVAKVSSFRREETNFGIEEGKTVKCSEDDSALFRMANNERHYYPSKEIAAAWDPNWQDVTIVNCTDIPQGEDMSIPSGDVKASADEPWSPTNPSEPPANDPYDVLSEDDESSDSPDSEAAEPKTSESAAIEQEKSADTPWSPTNPSEPPTNDPYDELSEDDESSDSPDSEAAEPEPSKPSEPAPLETVESEQPAEPKPWKPMLVEPEPHESKSWPTTSEKSRSNKDKRDAEMVKKALEEKELMMAREAKHLHRSP